MSLKVKKLKVEQLYILLFFFCIILSQGIRDVINTILGNNILNYGIFEILIIILIILSSKKISGINFIAIFAIISINIISYVVNDISFIIIFRSIFTFFLPLSMFLIKNFKVDIEYILSKSIKMLSVLIYISFIYSIFEFLFGNAIAESRRTGGIIGHPLTAAWYYVIYLNLNCIYCRYFKNKNSFSIAKDVLIAIIGITLGAGRIGLLVGLLVSCTYIYSCMNNKWIKYVILPIVIVCFMFTPIVKELIWDKFEVTIRNGDITNGRLWAIREMRFFDIYPNFAVGNGIGYSNYISQYLFGTFNFENPIIMFSFDYGILTVIIMVIISMIKPAIIILRNRRYILLLNFICMQIVPYTYNGLAESTGLFMVLMFLSQLYLVINKNINTRIIE